jgi:hypothetical protein
VINNNLQELKAQRVSELGTRMKDVSVITRLWEEL